MVEVRIKNFEELLPRSTSRVGVEFGMLVSYVRVLNTGFMSLALLSILAACSSVPWEVTGDGSST